jgi:hypothetical protein
MGFPSPPDSRGVFFFSRIPDSKRRSLCCQQTNMDQLSGWRVADKLEKRSLLIAVNCVAALSIFFFGYDQ